MKTRTILSPWMYRDGRRLDCGPYMSGALEARVILERLSVRKDALRTLTTGHAGGIFNGPQFSRTWVESPEHGVPFLGSSSMLQADLSNLPLIRKKDALSNRLSFLCLEKGMTLISCSGTIGRMVYVRPDMAGMWSSQDIMKVVPDAAKIPPGYLYAYLSSKFGVPLVVGGTYGAIIQHIEPHHIAELPVPRLGKEVEGKVHALVEEAAEKRFLASNKLLQAISFLEESVGLEPLPSLSSPTPFGVNAVSSNNIQARFDAFFHSVYHNEPLRRLATCQSQLRTVEDFAERVIEPGRFKRIPVDDLEFGVPFFGTSPLMWSEPSMSYLLPKRLRNLRDYIVNSATLLIPRSGQLSGIIGTAVMPYGEIIGGAVSEDAIRIYCPTIEVAGFLYVALTSQYGRRQLKARAYGSSIPHLDVKQIGRVLIPVPAEKEKAKIAELAVSTARLRHEAIELEKQSKQLVEQSIAEAH